MADRRAFHNFVTKTLRNELVHRYRRLEILSEADMQAFVWRSMEKFLRKKAVNSHMYQLANERYLKNVRKHPDLMVLRREKPWACIELKEKRIFVSDLIEKDWNRLIDFQSSLGVRRGYFIYLAGDGDPKLFKKHAPRKRGLTCVPILMSSNMPADEFAAWQKEYRRRSKLDFSKTAQKRIRPKAMRAAAGT